MQSDAKRCRAMRSDTVHYDSVSSLMEINQAYLFLHEFPVLQKNSRSLTTGLGHHLPLLFYDTHNLDVRQQSLHRESGGVVLGSLSLDLWNSGVFASTRCCGRSFARSFSAPPLPVNRATSAKVSLPRRRAEPLKCVVCAPPSVVNKIGMICEFLKERKKDFGSLDCATKHFKSIKQRKSRGSVSCSVSCSNTNNTSTSSQQSS
jgi:hypothetical protein